jgi:hypothetical protein
MAKENVNISVADNSRTRFPEVVRALRDAGLDVTQELESLGIVSGSIESAKVADLQQMDGVTSVEKERTYEIAPPESPLQ